MKRPVEESLITFICNRFNSSLPLPANKHSYNFTATCLPRLVWKWTHDLFRRYRFSFVFPSIELVWKVKTPKEG
jgi:hypothetical protein